MHQDLCLIFKHVIIQTAHKPKVLLMDECLEIRVAHKHKQEKKLARLC